MFRNEFPLPSVITGKDYIITHTNDNVNHLFKFGFIKDAKIQKLFTSPSGHMAAYEIMGTVIALRDSDAACIYVSPLNNSI